MKHLLKIGVACIATNLAIAPAFASCLDDLKAKGEIVAGVGSMGQKPLIWQTADGGYDGFEWELYKYIGKELGLTPKFSITEWTTLIPGLQAKRWDIILSGMTITQERAEGGGIDFSYPYMMFYDGIIVTKDSPIQTVDDLKGKKLGSVLGSMDSLNAHMMVDAGKAAEVLDFNTYGDPFEALKNKQVDAVLARPGLVPRPEGNHERPAPRWRRHLFPPAAPAGKRRKQRPSPSSAPLASPCRRVARTSSPAINARRQKVRGQRPRAKPTWRSTACGKTAQAKLFK